MNLWNPQPQTLEGLAAILVTALLLGVVHGVTPDEHTWPITFSYSIASYSMKGGMRSGLLFSLAFTVQRALASELAFFALVGLLERGRWEYLVYVVVGVVMAGSGWYILRRGGIPHLMHSSAYDEAAQTTTPAGISPAWTYMPLVHGFIAGWGTGAFALIVYSVLAPATHSPWLAFLPGLFFGLGTMLTQVLIGALVGGWMQRRGVSERAMQSLARYISGRALGCGGLAFAIAGTVGLIKPGLLSFSIDTGIRVHNLAHLGIGFLLVAVTLLVIAWSVVNGFRNVHVLERRVTSQ